MWNRWNTDLDTTLVGLKWKDICLKMHYFMSMKLRSFYLKYINCMYATNVKLKICKYVDLDLCTFCKDAIEFHVHMYWNCPIIHRVWQQIIEFCKKVISDKEDYSKANCLLFGFDKPVSNIVILCCKYQMHNAQLFKKLISADSVLIKVCSICNLE